MKTYFKSRNLNSIKARKQSGFSLIEASIVVALIAIAAIVIYNKASSVRADNASSEEAGNYAVLAAKAVSRYSAQGDFVGVTAAGLINAGMVPSQMVKGVAPTRIIQTGWGTSVVAAPSTISVANDSLKMTYPAPRAQCPAFVTSAARSASKITVNTTVVMDESTGKPNVDVAALGTACDAGGTGNVNVILERSL